MDILAFLYIIILFYSFNYVKHSFYYLTELISNVIIWSVSNDRADMAELADALDLGSSVFDVQVRFLLSA
jgi:hypothetical protein